jgi:hypothetical protein
MPSQILELVRTLLEDELGDYRAATAGLDDQGWNDFGEVVGAAFQLAVTHRFGAGPGGVAELVDQARRPYLGGAVDVDPDAAQVLVGSVLGQDGDVARVLARFDEPDLALIELMLLRRLLPDAGMAGDGLNGFLDEAQAAASSASGSGAGRRALRDQPQA